MTYYYKHSFIVTFLEVFNLLAVCALRLSPHQSQTCTRQHKVLDERQAWLHQVRLLQIPIPPGTAPSKRQPKDWAVSRVKADVRLVESLGGEDGGSGLVMHLFDLDEDPTSSAYYLLGGNSWFSSLE